MQLDHHFDVPKHRTFRGWAGIVSSWSDKSAPQVEFGTWKQDSKSSGSVSFECQPFQLCMYGANTKGMAARDKFTYFAFAGLGLKGKLMLQRLPQGIDAKAVFEAGGWLPPPVTDMVNTVNDAAKLDVDDMMSAFGKLMHECAIGYGMNLGPRPQEHYFFAALSNWPMLEPLNSAFLALKEKQVLHTSQRKAASAQMRKDCLDKALADLKANNQIITP